MFELRNIPIQRKLRFVILATCTVALSVASSALFAIQYLMFRSDYHRDMESVGQIIASLSGPTIALGAPEATQDFLNGLTAKPRIVAAVITLKDGRTVANFGREWAPDDSGALRTEGFHTVIGDLILVQPIVNDGERLGTLYLLSDYGAASMRLHGLYAGILVIVLASSFLVAAIVSSRLERVICGPIQALADTAHQITARSDYRLRAERSGEDEVGEFTDAFNSMLDQIERREAALQHEISERKRTEEELQVLHRQLMDASRQAGMAEVATGVLHNVGNVLNSVNVSATLISERLADRRLDHLTKAAELLRSQNGGLPKYLTEDPKGRLLPGYIAEAAGQILRDRAAALGELELLTRNIEHIKDIVAMQQNYAKVSGVIESLHPADLIEDALRMNLGAIERHRVKLTRDFAAVPVVAADKHKVLQILVNLIRNAKYAIDEANGPERELTLRLYAPSTSVVAIDVVDTGVGIPQENLTRIFSHGFTTRKEGHGFGLHSAALAAQQMGGRLFATSLGPGQGATFTLELPAAQHSALLNTPPTEPETVLS